MTDKLPYYNGTLNPCNEILIGNAAAYNAIDTSPNTFIIASPPTELSVTVFIKGIVEFEINLNEVMPINNLIEIFDKHFAEQKTSVKIAQALPVKLDIASVNKHLITETKGYRVESSTNTRELCGPEQDYLIRHFIWFELREFDFKDLVKGE